MKLIEALKKVQMNLEKIGDLKMKVAQHSANLSHETPVYGANQQEVVSGWLQTIEDLASDNVKLLVAIQRTNIATPVTIEIGGQNVTKSIAEWIWWRREYARLVSDAWVGLTDRNLREGSMPSTIPGGEAMKVTIVRHYDPELRDKKVSVYRQEPALVDSTLEVVNAVTDLIE